MKTCYNDRYIKIRQKRSNVIMRKIILALLVVIMAMAPVMAGARHG